MKFALLFCLGLVASASSTAQLRLPLPAAIRATHPWLDTEPINSEFVKVVGGENAAEGEAPYQIALFRSGSFTCGGSLIGPSTVLTAAHCIFGYENSPTIFTIRYGSVNRDAGPAITVNKINRHEGYASATIDYDVATLILSTPFTPSATAAIISLTSTAPAVGSTLKLTGWGRLTGGGTLPTLLQKAETLTIITPAECQTRWGTTNTITDRMVCAFSTSQSSCHGDSGGPLVQNGVQMAVVSWGSSSCLHATYPNVYANIANLLSWIQANS